ncbi:MAG: hypothetical protein ABIR26_06140 [Ramlibacter sp.]
MDSSIKKSFSLKQFFGGGSSAQDKLSRMVRYALAIFGLLAVAYVGTTVFITQRVGAQAQLGGFAVSALTFNNELLEMRRNEKDFLERKTRAELDKHKINYDHAVASIAKARDNPQADAENVKTLEKVEADLATYRKAFVAAADQQVALGLDENTGLQGELRKSVRAAEATVTKLGVDSLEVSILSLRRHEKDFILRERDEYVANFDKAMAQLKEQVAAAKMDPATRQAVSEQVAAYDKSFHDFVTGTLAVNKAVAAARAAARLAEEPVPALVEAASARREAAAALARASLIGSALALVVALAGVGLLLWNTKKSADATLAERLAAQQKAEAENEMLNNSVISILEAVNQLSQRDLTARAPVTQDIIGTVSDSINALTDETVKVLRDVATIAGNVAMASGKVKGQADLVSRTAEDERKSVGEVIVSLADASGCRAGRAEQPLRRARHAGNRQRPGNGERHRQGHGVDSRNDFRNGKTHQAPGRAFAGNYRHREPDQHHLRTHPRAGLERIDAGRGGRRSGPRFRGGGRRSAAPCGKLTERHAADRHAGGQHPAGNQRDNRDGEPHHQPGCVGSEQAQKAGEQMRLTQEITGELVAQVRRIASSSEAQKATSAGLLKSVQGIGQSTERTAQQIESQNQETETLLDSARRLVESVNVFKLAKLA